LRERAGIRAWGFEKRLEREEGSRIARLCWKEIQSRALEGGGMSKWEKERADCYKRWKLEMKEIESKREKGKWGAQIIREEERELQRVERWEKIVRSRYNIWYKSIKGEGISGI